MKKAKFIQSKFIQAIGQDKYDEIKKFIDEDGCIFLKDLHYNELKLKGKDVNSWFEGDAEIWMLKSLAGIDHNNGWEVSEDCDNLPKDLQICHFIPVNNFEERFIGFINRNSNEVYFVDQHCFETLSTNKNFVSLNSWLPSQITHWQPIFPIGKSPIF